MYQNDRVLATGSKLIVSVEGWHDFFSAETFDFQEFRETDPGAVFRKSQYCSGPERHFMSAMFTEIF